MTTLRYLIARNCKLFFKDKGTFFTAFIAPLVLLVLFVTFLGNVYYQSLRASLPEGAALSVSVENGFVGGFLLSSLLAVCCVTVPFTANMIMVQDKVTGRISDLRIAPVRASALALGYYLSTAVISLLICLSACLCGFVYLAVIGWHLSPSDVFLCLFDVALLVLFGTALSSVVCRFLRSQGGIAAVTTIVSSVYGFLCGAYMPFSNFSSGIRTLILCLPGTYGTVLLRNHLMSGAAEAAAETLPPQAIEELRKAFDLTMSFGGGEVTVPAAYLVLCGAVLVLIGVYVALCAFGKSKRK
ncbi:MAG: ABC transporter permease [Candidatus Gallimonas sp.]